MPKPIWTVDQIAAQLTRDNIAWDGSEPIAYSFYVQPAAHLGFTTNFSVFTAVQRQVLADIFELVSDVVPLAFVQVSDNGQDPGPGNERIGFYNIDDSAAPFWGAAINLHLQPSGGQQRLSGADVVVNLYNSNAPAGWDPGDRNFSTMMHEALHALGLPHPGDYDGQGIETYESDAEYQQDSGQYTVMSYWAAWETGANHLVDGVLYHAASPLIHDIAALQKLYGANMETRTGDTVYGFNSTADRAAYDFALNPKPIFSIWDAGGVDTLDLSGFATASRIDLGEGAFSDAGGLTKNISIAHGVTVENAIGGTGADSLTGNGAANVLTGGGGDDQLNGGLGNDRLDGGSGADTMAGGAGSDTYFVGSPADKVVETTAAGGTDTVRSAISYSLGNYVEQLVLTGTASLNGTGNNLANRLTGNSGANVLDGGSGNDVLDGAAGADRMTGGTGDDTFVVDNARDVIIELAGEGTDRVHSSVSFVLASSQLENLTLTGSAVINGTGNARANSLTGNAAVNILDGAAGADTMNGGSGNDTYVVDNAGDKVIETSGNGGIDAVRSLVSYTLAANVENIFLGGSAATNGTGNGLANALTGNSASNVLNGGGGNDVLDGAAGADAMNGAAGDDTYVVDNVGDSVTEASAAGGVDTVRSTIAFRLPDHVDKLVLTGSAAVNGIGNALANSLTGNSAANSLSGGAGNDLVHGGAGNDRLTGNGGTDRLEGGAGYDAFIFNSRPSASNVDAILDYYAASDSILLSRLVFTNIGPNGRLSAAAFRLGSAAADATDRIVYDQAAGKLYYDADGTGAAAQTLFATVTAGTALSYSEFTIYG